jgi:hypothetical protein
MARGEFAEYPIHYDSPGRLGAKVTKNDTNLLPEGAPRGFLVGTAGTATLIDLDGNTRENVPLQQGYNPIRNIKIVKTGGTADDIWPYY